MNTIALSVAAVVLGGGGLIQLLIWLLVLSLIIYVVFLVLGMIPLPEPARRIVTIILAVIFLLVLLSHLGIMI